MHWLAIDIGNTQTVLGLYEVDTLDGRFSYRLLDRIRFRTDAGTTPDEWRRQVGLGDPDARTGSCRIDRAIVASVVPQLHPVIGEALQGLNFTLIDHRTPRDFELALPHPEQLGADRLANLMGALAHCDPPFLVMDSGTATTFCLMDSKRRYLGGAIVPGLETSFSALQARAARLFSVELVRPESSVGNTTESQLQSGLLQGTEALIEGLAERLLQDAEKEFGEGFKDAKRLVTGGCIHYLKLGANYEFLPDLTLEGLLHYGRRIALEG